MIIGSKKLHWISLMLLVIVACGKPTSIQEESRFYADVLDLKKLPEEISDHKASSFSDLGAWFSYAISPEPTGGFTGPYIMSIDNGVWFSKALSNLTISIDGQELDYQSVKNYQTYALPGKLLQTFELGDLQIEQQVIFVSSNTSLIYTKIVSSSSETKAATLTWKGSPWIDEIEVGINGMNEVVYSFNDHQILIQASGESKASISEKEYEIVKSVELGDDPVEVSLIHTLLLPDDTLEQVKEQAENALLNSQSYLISNQERWEEMVKVVACDSYDSAYKMLAVKALETLTNNWRSEAGDLKFQGLFPSYAYRWFYGFWSWDSWKHAVALAEINPELAKDQIRTMYAFQNEYGMIADCIYRDTAIEDHNWRDTKPPLSGWAIYEVFNTTNDTSFVEELYPKLEKYHQWWYTDRDHDQNGLCEYGSTDGTRVAAAWESGMDNAVRFDDAVMVQNNDHAWSLSQESVDLNAYLFAEKNYMVKLAKVIDQPTQELEQEADTLKEQIQKVFYDAATGFFYDVSLADKEKIKIKGPEGWIPLWAKAATEEQAQGVAMNVIDTALFNTYMPLPTLNASHEKFNPKKGYWRGPVWLDQAYFAMNGLNKYGHSDYATQLKNKLLQNGEGILEKGAPLRENYHPVTGEGLNARHFSWTAAHILLMLKEDY